MTTSIYRELFLVMILLKRKNVRWRSHTTWSLVALSTLLLTPGLLLTSAHLPAAYAQAITDDDVTNYARAVVDIETERLSAYETASDLLASVDSELSLLDTPLRCNKSRVSDMPDMPKADRVELRTILVDFCNSAKAIAETNELTPKRFNSITASHKEDAELEDRIKDAIKAL